MGSGTVGIAAWQLGRKFLGIDLNADYCDLARTRLLSGNPYSARAATSHVGPPGGSPIPEGGDEEGAS